MEQCGGSFLSLWGWGKAWHGPGRRSPVDLCGTDRQPLKKSYLSILRLQSPFELVPCFTSSFTAIFLDLELLVLFGRDFIIFIFLWQIRELFPSQSEFSGKSPNCGILSDQNQCRAADLQGIFRGVFAHSGYVGGCGWSGRSGLSPGSRAESLHSCFYYQSPSGRCSA